MTATLEDPEVRSYMRALGRVARALPADERRELLGSIEEHIAHEVPPGASRSEVRSALERIGDPRTLVVEALGPDRARRGRGRGEWAAIVLLPLGGLVVPVLGWLAGVILLWGSDAWTAREKLLGTLVVPGGLLLPVVLLPVLAESCSEISGPGRATIRHCTAQAPGGDVVHVLFLLALAAASIGAAIVLGRRARRVL